jgi:Zn-finger nucleic acid-binding protein
VNCSNCARELPSGFPGATITCDCGAKTVLPMTSSIRAESRALGGPYRAASATPSEPLQMRCPFCGNTCPSLVRVCPHCDVRLENVRCVRCYSLSAPGSFACGRCGQSLELEPLLDATDAPCPRCRTPLEAAAAGAWDRASVDDASVFSGDGRTHECPRCGGMFVPREALAEILCQAEVQGAFPTVVPSVPSLGEVTYIPCPQCHAPMNRTNFGKVSGVIVDVCRKHGTWFDGGELTRVVAFAASGGLAKSRARENQEKREHDEKRAASRTELAIYTPREQREERLDALRDFLHSILWF